jgi:hypothetical protein
VLPQAAANTTTKAAHFEICVPVIIFFRARSRFTPS